VEYIILLEPFTFTSKIQRMKIDDAMLDRSIHICGIDRLISYFFNKESSVLFEISARIDHSVHLGDELGFLSVLIQNEFVVRFK